MEVQAGLVANGIPLSGRREFRPAKEDDKSNIVEVLVGPIVILVGMIYGTALTLYRVVTRLFLRKPTSVKGRICFVSGSGRGLGREICLGLAKKGAILALADINETTNRETLQMVEKLGAKAKMYTLNISNKQDVEMTVDLIEKELGPVYLVVNNAALVLPMLEPTEEFTRASFNVNILGHIWVTKAFLHYLKNRDEGHIINISSIASYYSSVFLEEYSATKAALRSWSNALLLRLKMEKSNIKVTCINPTFINTTEDYRSLHSGMFNLYHPTQTVVDSLMWAVKYDLSSDFSVPGYYKLIFLLLQFFPAESMIFVFNMLTKKVILPTNKEYENLPSAKIVSLSKGQDFSKNGIIKSD